MLPLSFYIMINQKRPKSALGAHTKHGPDTKILESIRQNRLEYFKKYGKQRHGIRKNNGYGIRIRCIIHQPKREKPVTVPEKAPAQIILSQIPATEEPVRVGDIQYMNPKYTDKCNNSNQCAKYPHIVLFPII